MATFDGSVNGQEDGVVRKRASKKCREHVESTRRTTPDSDPQLKTEYIYAGSRLLAVEDANANAAPPADLAVWRPSTGVWWVYGGPGSAQTSYPWGHTSPPDIPIPGDYDGDGKTDFATIQPAASPATSTWWIVPSSTGTYYSVSWGNDADKAAQADYDGDGKTDLAVFRPSTGVWYIYQSSNGQTLQVTSAPRVTSPPLPITTETVRPTLLSFALAAPPFTPTEAPTPSSSKPPLGVQPTRPSVPTTTATAKLISPSSAATTG